MPDYPHTIENWAGEHLTFVRVVREPFDAPCLLARYKSEFGMSDIHASLNL